MSLFKLLTFSLFFSVIQADGEFTVLHSPEAIVFKGHEELESFYVGDVLLAAMGEAVTGNSKWSAMLINNPFSLANTSLVIVHIQGTFHVQTYEEVKTYELIDSETQSSLSSFVTQVGRKSVTEFNFCNHSKGVQAFQSYYGDVEIKVNTSSKNFKPIENVSHKNFLEEIAYMHAIADNMTNFLKPAHVILIRVSLEALFKKGKFAIQNEAKQLVGSAVIHLLTAAKNYTDALFFVQTTDKLLAKGAIMRGTQSHKKSNPFDDINSSDYPIVFNIVLWLGLGLGLALAVICHIIANIDPGRDSIIYRISYAHRMSKKRR